MRAGFLQKVGHQFLHPVKAGVFELRVDDARFSIQDFKRPLRMAPQESQMSRIKVTERIITAKINRGLKWTEVAAKVERSKEWVTAACLGQMTLTKDQAAIVGTLFGLTEEEQQWLTVPPSKGSLPTSIPTDPLIYRFYELVNVY